MSHQSGLPKKLAMYSKDYVLGIYILMGNGAIISASSKKIRGSNFTKKVAIKTGEIPEKSNCYL
jgi:hypothetical protein